MMQTARMLGGLAIVLVSAWAVRADPITEMINLPEVIVRGGPSPQFDPTSKLHKGDTVRVLREEATGWLAIVPPAESFSWIDTRQVEQSGANAAVVSAAEAPIWVGSRLKNSEPTVSRIKAPKGTQLAVIGKPVRAPGGMRLPILPVPAEVRYIPAEAIRPGAAPQQFAAAAPEQNKPSSASTGFVASVPPATSPTSSPPPSAPSSNTNPLWLQAEEAERAGDLVRAQGLLQELADQVRQTDFQLWARCINRIEFLREQRHNGPGAQVPTSMLAAANANSGTVADRLTPSPAGSPAPAPSTLSSLQQPRAASEYCYVQDPRYTAKLSPPVLDGPSPPPPSGQWSDVGRLRRTAFALPDGRPLFCLQPFGPNQRHMYVAAGPDVKLELYVERNVYLYGPVVYSGELRTNFMTVVQARSAR